MSIDPSRYGVHVTHCCVSHGCKYGDVDCPVTTGKLKQKYPCEDCGDEFDSQMPEEADSQIVLANLVRDSLAADFNEHWDSYKAALALATKYKD